jgi:transketolase
VLSAGHGSAMLYSLLHLFGFEGMSIDELKNFRQLNSKTPGHPEYGHTAGVEVSTGPLGAGMSNAVGLAIAEQYLASQFNEDNYNIIDHYTYVLGGDGCMMEGITSEAMSLAGTLKLSKLIVFYDSNNITIEGNTDTAFTEDVKKRFESYSFQIIEVDDGNDIDKISAAIDAAKSDKQRPSLIIVKTIIGYGAGKKQGTAGVHGEPLGEEGVSVLRQSLSWDENEPFKISDDIYTHYKTLAQNGEEKENSWNKLFDEYSKKYPDKKSKWNDFFSDKFEKDLSNNEDFWKFADKPNATRASSGEVINKLKDIFPNLLGGSADLAPSNKTLMNNIDYFSPENRAGRNIHFGVREFAMGGIMNGIAIHSCIKIFAGTFFVFSDYIKPMIRLAALMGLPTTYVLTHDSIGVGEDGPTHEPIEQLAMLRTIPNINVFRPCDYTETACAYYSAMTSKHTPTAIALTRQNLKQIPTSSKDALKGGYVIKKEKDNNIDLIIIATGSEVALAIDAAEKLEQENKSVRVVSMPCTNIFDRQDSEYKNSILPNNVRARLAIEAGNTLSMSKYVGLDGKVIGIDTFGASAPANVLFKEFGFTIENVVETAKELL